MNQRDPEQYRIGRTMILASALTLALSACVSAPTPEAYTPPQQGLELTWSKSGNKASGGKAATEILRHRVIVSGAQEALYQVVSKDASNGDRVHIFHSIFSYAYWRPGTMWVEYKFDRAKLRQLWPLTPGKELRLKTRFGYGEGKTIEKAKANWRETEVGEIHYRVLRREKVTVPAGTFNAILIERVRRFTRHQGGVKSVERRIGWLVPKLGFVVKQTVHRNIGSPKEKKFSIQAISVKPANSAK
ncbi:MAG: hypothetical protein ACTSUD_13815 [Alphaproteobacteria bacterium]